MQDNSNEYDYDWSDDYENLDATGTLTQVGSAVLHGLAGCCAELRCADVQHGCNAAVGGCLVTSYEGLSSCPSFIQQQGNDCQTKAAWSQLLHRPGTALAASMLPQCRTPFRRQLLFA